MKAITLPQAGKRAIWDRETLSGALHLLAFLLAGLVIELRRPEALFHARFYAEDGALFYQEAYNHGWWRVVFIPYQGYLHLLPRLASGAALLVPLAFAPFVQNLIAVIIEAAPVSLLLSSASSEWGTLRFRAALACLYLLLPNSGVVIGSITESQWVLALCGLLILLAQPPKGSERYLYICLLILCGFTGPFSVLLLPFAIWKLLLDRSSVWRRTVAAILAAGAMAQAIALAFDMSRRFHADLGAGIGPFLRILGAQVFLGSLFGGNNLVQYAPRAALAIGVVGVALLGFSFSTERRELRALQVFAVLVLGATLARPIAMTSLGSTA